MSGDADDLDDADGAATGGQRLDKWLWFARVAKSRTLSAALVSEGKVRVNADKVDKPAHKVRIGDAVTILMRQRVRVLKVAGFGLRRGSAEVAGALYEDLTPAPLKQEASTADAVQQRGVAMREPGSGRPTKRERRELDRMKYRST